MGENKRNCTPAAKRASLLAVMNHQNKAPSTLGKAKLARHVHSVKLGHSSCDTPASVVALDPPSAVFFSFCLLLVFFSLFSHPPPPPPLKSLSLSVCVCVCVCVGWGGGGGGRKRWGGEGVHVAQGQKCHLMVLSFIQNSIHFHSMYETKMSSKFYQKCLMSSL